MEPVSEITRNYLISVWNDSGAQSSKAYLDAVRENLSTDWSDERLLAVLRDVGFSVRKPRNMGSNEQRKIRISREQAADIREARDKGVPWKELERRYKCTNSTLREKLMQHGMWTRKFRIKNTAR